MITDMDKGRQLGNMHLSQIQSPQDLRGLSYPELDDLACEIRQEIIRTVSRRGGHLASNLGVV